MAWGPLETRIDELRTAASRNPAAAIETITREIEQSTRPRDRVRLLGLRSGARKRLGHFDRAEQDLREARSIRRAGKIVETELDGRFADLKLTMALATGKGWKEAREFADIAVLSARELVRVKPGTSDWAIRQSRTRAALLTAALVTRGTILFYGYGLTEEALRDAREGIRSAPRWEREHNARRIAPLRSAYQLVCVCAMGHGASTEDLMLARELAVGFQIPREDVILRAQQRATVVCIDVKLGKTDPLQAENILQNDMANLRRLRAKATYDHIQHILVWLVSEYQKRPERAEWIRENLAWNGYPDLTLGGLSGKPGKE